MGSETLVFVWFRLTKVMNTGCASTIAQGHIARKHTVQHTYWYICNLQCWIHVHVHSIC